MPTHKQTPSLSHIQNHKAQLATAYNELGKELSSAKLRVVGNYTLGRVIGEGAYGKVRIGTHRLTSTRVAIKQIPKAMSASLTREIHHHRQLHHPHITQMYEVIATEAHIWIVSELCCGGELFDYLVEKGRLAEDEARSLFGQLCLAVDYLHVNNIVHRDLKLENVLLDEHCRVKLGDFGFTREFERGTLMETFCGTTGYASPEMLLAKKYQGPEVDVWSLGIILYCLLTGTLPFDDDDEDVMRSKIILGDFEDPDWLSLESRDLLKNILVKDVATRYTIPQILSHPWFTSRKATYETESPASAMPPFPTERPTTPDDNSRRNSQGTAPESSQASTQDSISPFIRHPDLMSSTPTTPEEQLHDPFESTANILAGVAPVLHRLQSDATLRTARAAELDSVSARLSDAIPEEASAPARRAPSPLVFGGTKTAPPSHPVRTPARTKRRSVSSVLSDGGSPAGDKPATPRPRAGAAAVDFQSLRAAHTPVIFSTPPERALLSTLAGLGLDTAQIVHSVLSNACDASGAMWWLLRRKELDGAPGSGNGAPPTDADADEAPHAPESAPARLKTPKKKRNKVSVGVQTEPPGSPPGGSSGAAVGMGAAVVAPQFALVPPTPTLAGRPATPPTSGARSPLLSPSSSTVDGARSHPTTPGGSMKEAGKSRKTRAGSVSIMQRATTALEAAGLVRKRSSDAVREEKEKEKERDRERSRETEREKKSSTSGEEPRASHGSGGSGKAHRSPPRVPTTPPPQQQQNEGGAAMGSPWVLADARGATSQPGTLGHTHGHPRGEMAHSHSAPNFTDAPAGSEAKPTTGGPSAAVGRNRANLLTAFRLWFNEDRKGKRKEGGSGGPPSAGGRRAGGGSSKFAPRAAPRTQRPSLSSRRSSSVNSRRSSGTSMHLPPVLDSPSLPPRRSFGAHTPSSERGEPSSRPSSVRSMSLQPHGGGGRHRKSPSQSSAGSVHLRAASPMQKYHRRGGSGSGSSTRVVRQAAPALRAHARSNSAASSVHSQPSSRPTSWYEPSESEAAAPRTASPFKARPRRSLDEPRRTASGGTSTSTFVAQKRAGPFQSPGGAGAGRSSWKKSWGMEPPGWSARTAHVPLEVLSVAPAPHEPATLRDVFAGRTSLAAGDESDWVDEDDDGPAFAGGLGQLAMPLHPSGPVVAEPKAITLSPAPRGHRTAGAGKRAGRGGWTGGRTKAPSPAERVSPLPSDTGYDSADSRPGRRQLPATRTGYSFRNPIQEEDEGEEE